MGLLALAGAVSGSGQAVTHGLSNLQTAVNADMLNAAQDKRVQAREDTAYARQRFNIADERAYTQQREQELYSLSQQRKDTEATAEIERTKRNAVPAAEAKAAVENAALDQEGGLAGKRAKVAMQANEFGKPLRDAQAQEKTENEIKDLTTKGDNESYTKAVKVLKDANSSPHERAAAKLVMQQWQARVEYGNALESGDPAKIKQAEARLEAAIGNPRDTKKADQISAAAGAKEAGNEIGRLEANLAKIESAMQMETPGSPGYTRLTAEQDRIKQQIENLQGERGAYSARLASLSGVELPKAELPSKGTSQINLPQGYAIPGQSKQPGGMIAQKTDAPPPDQPLSPSKLPQGAVPVAESTPTPKPEKPVPKDVAAYVQQSQDLEAKKPTAATNSPSIVAKQPSDQSPSEIKDTENAFTQGFATGKVERPQPGKPSQKPTPTNETKSESSSGLKWWDAQKPETQQMIRQKAEAVMSGKLTREEFAVYLMNVTGDAVKGQSLADQIIDGMTKQRSR